MRLFSTTIKKNTLDNEAAVTTGNANHTSSSNSTKASHPPSHPAISWGAIAGIAVGGFVGLSLISAVLALFLHARKKRNSSTADDYNGDRPPRWKNAPEEIATRSSSFGFRPHAVGGYEDNDSYSYHAPRHLLPPLEELPGGEDYWLGPPTAAYLHERTDWPFELDAGAVRAG